MLSRLARYCNLFSILSFELFELNTIRFFETSIDYECMNLYCDTLKYSNFNTIILYIKGNMLKKFPIIKFY